MSKLSANSIKLMAPPSSVSGVLVLDHARVDLARTSLSLSSAAFPPTSEAWSGSNPNLARGFRKENPHKDVTRLCGPQPGPGTSVLDSSPVSRLPIGFTMKYLSLSLVLNALARIGEANLSGPRSTLSSETSPQTGFSPKPTAKAQLSQQANNIFERQGGGETCGFIAG